MMSAFEQCSGSQNVNGGGEALAVKIRNGTPINTTVIIRNVDFMFYPNYTHRVLRGLCCCCRLACSISLWRCRRYVHCLVQYCDALFFLRIIILDRPWGTRARMYTENPRILNQRTMIRERYRRASVSSFIDHSFQTAMRRHIQNSTR